MRTNSFLLAALALCLFVGCPSAARAAFLYCNQTKTTIEAAFGHNDDGTWVSEGWWQIEPGQCARVTNAPLTQRFYFYYARALTTQGDGGEPMIWAGKYAFCIDGKAFRIEGDGECESRGYRKQGFQDVDIGVRQRHYTLTFQDVSGR